MVRWFGVVWWGVGLGGWVAGRPLGGERRGVSSFRFCERRNNGNMITQKNPENEKYEDLKIC